MVDQLYPQVGVSVVRVLRRLGVTVQFPASQVCCGQPLYNAGFTKPARQLARHTLRSLAGSQYVVVPSGSCAAMLKVFYLDLFAHDPALLPPAQELASRVYEFSQFLTEVLGVDDVGASYTGKAAYHPSCHLLRELGVREGPRRLLGKVQGLESVELPQAESCCGFGGAFSVKFPHISGGMLDDKLANLQASGADTLVACDMGCLMHLGGAIDRRSLPVKIRHLAQVLDGEAK
ncbi:MAG: (Fe-S)-binding protein [Dehalococcoidia bacterium]|nr:(Fe-S)-binding protein [Dehalococcoidia bacterium]MSQ16259.1 (Fe-S)-binding protein [Dehalococcoidia bacterium]